MNLPSFLRRGGAWCAAFACLSWLGGCASVPPGAGSNPKDPYEKFNRQVYSFNDHFDRAILKPVATGYQQVVPRGLRDCIDNAFNNIGEVGNFVNSSLQLKPLDAASDVGRLAINSTIGLLGCFDVANGMGIRRNKQDFGLTMGKWGIPSGPYLVLPILGPSSVRDGIGEIPDYFTDPVNYVTPTLDSYEIYVGRLVERRAQLLDASGLLDQAALDPYAFLRDAYLQRRRSRVYDGNPPREQDDDGDEDDGPTPSKPAAGSPTAQPGGESPAPATVKPQAAPESGDAKPAGAPQ